MGVSYFGRIRDAIFNRATRADQDTGTVGWHVRPVSGVVVTADTVLQNPTARACHRYLTQTVAQLPKRVMRDAGAASDRVVSHPVASIFNWRANPELSPFQLVETLTGWAITHGNGVAEIETDSVGRVVNLWPIHPDRVDIRRDNLTDALIYRISNGSNGYVDLLPKQVFHLRGFGNGPVGIGVVEYAAESLGWARATQLFGASFFGNGLNAGGVIEGAGNLSEPAQARLRQQIDNRYGGPRKAHRPLFLDKAMKWVRTTIAPNEAQFLETMQFQVEEVCRVFGVPPQKVHHLLRMTFNNVEQLSIEVVVDAITPWVIRWEEEANYKLFGQNRLGLFVKFDLKGLLRGDFKSRMEGYNILRRIGVMNADQICDLEEIDKPPENLGKKYIVDANMTTLEMVGEPQASATQAPEPENHDQPPAAQVRRIRTLRRLGVAARAA